MIKEALHTRYAHCSEIYVPKEGHKCHVANLLINLEKENKMCLIQNIYR